MNGGENGKNHSFLEWVVVLFLICFMLWVFLKTLFF